MDTKLALSTGGGGGDSAELLLGGQNLYVYSQELFFSAISHLQLTEV